MLAALGGHSSHLAHLAQAESQAILDFAQHGADHAFAEVLAPLQRLPVAATRSETVTRLRRSKRRGALIAAAADLQGRWSLAQVTGALSQLAEATIDHACAYLLREAAQRGDLRLPRAKLSDARGIAQDSGLAILGMGKLGGRELNYSSDIDLVILYDPHVAAYHAEAAGALYVRLARDLVRMMEERTADGYVFRTDLRLRPDPAATPLAVNILTAITYYESLGQNWERAAMIKARPVGGDRQLGQSFLDEIRPFVWRRHLDFATIADFQAIKTQIHAAHEVRGAHKTVQVAGHNVKLGRGGIREIEFTTQVLQLIWGGRDPGLRNQDTLGALASLAEASRLSAEAAAELSEAYVFLRDVEHRLQMVDDRQTHQLPEDEVGLARIASFMGFADLETFADELVRHLSLVEAQYAHLFEQSSESDEHAADDPSAQPLLFPPDGHDALTLARLSEMGFREPTRASTMMRDWQAGRVRAVRSSRARDLLRRQLPAILAALAAQREPDVALSRFDAILSDVSTGVQLLSLFQRNPALLRRVADILGAAPALADHLAHNPSALEGLLTESGPGSSTALLPALVGTARHFEEALEGARRLVTEGKFEIDSAALEAAIDVDAAGEARSDLADAAISALVPHVFDDFARRFGKVRHGSLGIIALGKLGGREMLPASDLDLVLIYDHPENVSESHGGPRSLPSSVYFAKLAQQVVAAFTSPGAEGKLYEVDMRLRPSGNKGPVATSLSSFKRYHAESAWTWERMALTRARPVFGTQQLRKRLSSSIRDALLMRVEARVLPDAVSMRARMLRDLPADGPWDLKARPGGLVEVEFVAQALQLAYAQKHPEVLAASTRMAIAALARHDLLTQQEASTLIEADRLYRTLTGLLRLTVGPWRRPELPPSVGTVLLRGTAGLTGTLHDLPMLRDFIEKKAADVRQIFEDRLGRLAEEPR
ncbi:bifunctional [glutamine synthetase] adenylyltransferase/[glutamine synthetase]-adenylyl-L-tyrosine phosphorylase [Pseudoroseomonas globiformis]|uniref:Bifunctional glutamine synthetase adenylyltransferase/adenylyl-removing enzyme n=1 Tax=Teichococcus globiformis TaxID=2307229 RepID=A0ABV7G3N6_9PROT